MRLDKLLSETGHGSRREVREIIRKQRITVNGSIAAVPEMQVPEDAEIRMDGVLLEKPGPVYLMLHKPAGYLTAVSDRSRPVVMELVELVRGPHTGDETVETAKAFARNTGKTPIVINNDKIANRQVLILIAFS